MSEHPAQSKRPRREASALVALALLCAAAAVGVAVWALLANPSPPTVSGTDLNGNRVTLDVELTAAQTAQQQATEDGQGRLRVEAVGLNVPLGAMNEVDGAITPPGFTSAYWVRNHGTSPDAPDDGTVFVAMHALRSPGMGPGNYLYEPGTGASRLSPGDIVQVVDTNYSVETTLIVAQSELANRSDIWLNTPGRLVMITCIQLRPSDEHPHNFVVIAQRTAG